MKTFFTLKKLLMKAFCMVAFSSLLTFSANAQSFVEEFDTVSNIWSNGWDSINHSATHGPTTWFQGNGAATFPAYSGMDINSYIGANYNSVSGSGTISTWLFAPLRTLNNGDVILFYTRKTDSSATAANNYPDRLQVRLSTNGASVDVGTTPTDVGDYTTLLLDINPTLTNNGYPDGYPYMWMMYALTLSGLSGPTPGRFAFRYFVTNGGFSGSNSDYIGIDSVAYIEFDPNGIEPIHKNVEVSVYPNPANGVFRIQFNAEKSQDGILEVVNKLGQVVYSENISMTAGTNTHRLDLKALSNGAYSLKMRTANESYNQKLIIQD